GNIRARPGDELMFEPGRGGDRIHGKIFVPEDKRDAYLAASRFGEVNTYYHLDRIGAYVAKLLCTLGIPALPRVIARVTAHGAATIDPVTGLRDGMRSTSRWRPFQGGHYRLPSHEHDIPECQELSATGEIHLGPGWRRTNGGELFKSAGVSYMF